MTPSGLSGACGTEDGREGRGAYAPEDGKWEIWRDRCYYEMWAVRPVGSRNFYETAHFSHREDAEAFTLGELDPGPTGVFIRGVSPAAKQPPAITGKDG